MQHGHVKSAARVFAILEYFAEHREHARLSDLLDKLGYPASNMTAILRTMISLGYMDLDQRTHRYFPSPRLTRLTNWIESGGYEQTKVLDAMYRLRDRGREPVVLATQNGIYIEYVISLHCYEGTNSHIEPGARRLMIQNGIGWLLLSRQPADEAASVYRDTIRAGLLEATAYPETAFQEILAAHRTDNISILHARDLLERTAHWDASIISTLLPVPDGHHRSLGLGLHGPTRQFLQREGELTKMLRETVQELRSELGQ